MSHMFSCLFFRYDPLSSCLVDFHGRANVASVKNFQIIRSDPVETSDKMRYSESEQFILQMGKVLLSYIDL